MYRRCVDLAPLASLAGRTPCLVARSIANAADQGATIWPPPPEVIAQNPLLADILRDASLNNRVEESPSPSSSSLQPEGQTKLLASAIRLAMQAQRLMKSKQPPPPSFAASGSSPSLPPPGAANPLTRTSLRRIPVAYLRAELRTLGDRQVVATKEAVISRLQSLLAPALPAHLAQSLTQQVIARRKSLSTQRTQPTTTTTTATASIPWPSASQVAPLLGRALATMHCKDILLITIPPDRNPSHHPFHTLILATATSTRHVTACAAAVVYEVRRTYPQCPLDALLPSRFARNERGWKRSEPSTWEVVDLTEPGPGIMVSIMTSEERERLGLESRWALNDLSNVVRIQETDKKDNRGRIYTLDELTPV